MKNNIKKIITITSVTAALALLSAGVWANFQETVTDKVPASIGTVSIDDITIALKLNDKTVTSITDMAPGDIADLSWTVSNTGTLSIATRNTIYLWTDNNYFEDSLYLFSGDKTNTDIKQMLLKEKTVDALKFTADTFTINKKEHTGYKYVIAGDILDGVGTGAQTGDAFEVNYGLPEDGSDTSDTLKFRLGLSNYATFRTMDSGVHICVVTEAMQHKNTSDSDWEVIAVNEITTGGGNE